MFIGSGLVYRVRSHFIGSELILEGQSSFYRVGADFMGSGRGYGVGADFMGSGRGDGVRWVPRLLIGPYKGRLLGWPYVAQPPHFLL